MEGEGRKGRKGRKGKEEGEEGEEEEGRGIRRGRGKRKREREREKERERKEENLFAMVFNISDLSPREGDFGGELIILLIDVQAECIYSQP